MTRGVACSSNTRKGSPPLGGHKWLSTRPTNVCPTEGQKRQLGPLSQGTQGQLVGQRLLAEKPTSATYGLSEPWLVVGLLCAADFEAGR